MTAALCWPLAAATGPSLPRVLGAAAGECESLAVRRRWCSCPCMGYPARHDPPAIHITATSQPPEAVLLTLLLHIRNILSSIITAIQSSRLLRSPHVSIAASFRSSSICAPVRTSLFPSSKVDSYARDGRGYVCTTNVRYARLNLNSFSHLRKRYE